MKKILIFVFLMLFIVFVGILINPISSKAKDWNQVQKILSQNGVQQDDTIRFDFYRTDVYLKINGAKVNSYPVLDTWVAFTPMLDHTMMMCTFVLLQSEVEPVIEKLIANNIQVMGIHNHHMYENPRIIFMHCCGHGDAAKLAEVFKEALNITNTPPISKPTDLKSDIDWQKTESIIGLKGKKQADMIIFSTPRADKIYDMDVELNPLSGVGQTIVIQKAGDKAIAIGDFVVTAQEVNPVLKALTLNGLRVTSIHNHMLEENPRTFCLHYWGFDTQEKLAKGLRAALDKINIIR